jgi:ribonucleoside-diphosphate reductase alpha chain
MQAHPASERPRRPSHIQRRDGTVEAFDTERIRNAVTRAAREVGQDDPSVPESVTRAVVEQLADRFGGRAPQVEEIQDAVEAELMTSGYDDIARAYVVYRLSRAELRESKSLLEVRDELKLSLAAVTVLRERYLLRDERGRIVESTGELMDRVASFVARAEDLYRPGSSGRWASEFSEMLRQRDFLPNSPTLMNAGTSIGLLSGCVVLPLEDSLSSIFGALGHAALIHQGGGGTGYSFSHLRPAGDQVRSTHGKASGPLSFLEVFDCAAGVIRRGGRRRGASMAVLDVSHPDIYEFVTAKSSTGVLEHFNLSVAVTDSFLRAVTRGAAHRLVNPRTGRVVAKVAATGLFEVICESAWRSGDPGLLFLDAVNRANPLPGRGRIEATNPCGEVPLCPHESCNLGSINLAHFARDRQIDWNRLGSVVRLAVRFLDDVIDVSRYPIPELEDAALKTRKVGLGVMGLAELLAVLGVPYDSATAVRQAARLAKRVRDEARGASAELARERGAFPLFSESTFARSGFAPLRNSQLTSVAPTGTISLIAGTTSGIEPMFAIAYVRNILDRHLVELNPLFDRLARDRGFYSEDLTIEIARTGGVRHLEKVPPEVRASFPTALEISPEWHLLMQSAVQRHVDAAVSKTINLPPETTPEDIRDIFLSAWRARVKGITVYRYGSKPGQVLTLLEGDKGSSEPAVRVDAAFVGGCAAHACEF